MKTIKVKSALDTGFLALWEKHDDHPKGEVFIIDDSEHEVALTETVKHYLEVGRLVMIEEKRPVRKAYRRKTKVSAEPEVSDGDSDE